MEIKQALLELSKLVLAEAERRYKENLQPISDALTDYAKNVIKEHEIESQITDVEFEESATENVNAIEEELPKASNPYELDWPNSSNITKTKYDNKERVLIVTFKTTGKRYAYLDFLEKDWSRIVKLYPSGSIGKHINSEVKGVHTSTPLDAPTPAPSKNNIADTDL